ncbi:MAG TPA: PIN domain-containing protein [Candidatus Paceibacterota bacterium]|nr:PIN domain-containing protein [Candidatus Paceibacterota bacterium]
METFLIDTGPLVALLDRSDAQHEWAVEQFSHLRSPPTTCEGAISEATHLLQDAGVKHWGVLELVERKIISVQFDLEPNLDRVLSLMNKYADTPMDFVDACLVAMTEEKRDCQLLTLDSDFKIYRRFERQVIPLIIPAK